MRLMPTACALLISAHAATALANPCSGLPPTSMKTVDSWQAVYARINQGNRTAATPALATNGLCAAKDAQRPCGPDAPISVIYDYYDLAVALVFKNPLGTYTVLTLPIDLPTHTHAFTMTKLGNGLLHINANWEELGREMFCEDVDRDKDGNCVDGMSATVGLGHTYVDLLVDPIGRSVRWSNGCHHEEEAPRRMSSVTHMPDGALVYNDCAPMSKPQWFTLNGDRCAPIKAPIDATALLRKARAAAKAGDFKAAVAHLDSILRGAPGRTDYLSERGYLRYKAGDLAGALVDLEAARRTYPALKLQGMIQFNIGLVKAAQGDKAGALEAFGNANRMRPSKAAKAKIAELKISSKQ